MNEQDTLDATLTLIHSRQHPSPKRLGDLGPNAEQIGKLLAAAGAAPDHGQISPWHMVTISPKGRHLLAEAFADALVERAPGATEAQKEEARGRTPTAARSW
jgi:nitroreductase